MKTKISSFLSIPAAFGFSLDGKSAKFSLTAPFIPLLVSIQITHNDVFPVKNRVSLLSIHRLMLYIVTVVTVELTSIACTVNFVNYPLYLPS